ncbi:MAG: hypothetical protein JWQ34_2279 [Mucilaginibacter sp.]|uniref:hypothetical protein n=1 Tax=Mucilaginibacter sp. TaxID=1882438 RepID=UPI00262AEF93|nr:hypothetical protein [Mucilaginibacter sp.]MDB5004054.1 hypothetical protein [Mucilaginibacter sp.]
MTEPINYTIYKDNEEHTIIITPVNQNIAGGDVYITGVFRLTEGEVGMGDIVFDDNMKQWEYTGMGDLTHKDAAEIAEFIQVKNASLANNGKTA